MPSVLSKGRPVVLSVSNFCNKVGCRKEALGYVGTSCSVLYCHHCLLLLQRLQITSLPGSYSIFKDVFVQVHV